MAYSAGNLELSIQTISKDTISSLDTLIARLNTIIGIIGKVPNVTNMISQTMEQSKSLNRIKVQLDEYGRELSETTVKSIKTKDGILEVSQTFEYQKNQIDKATKSLNQYNKESNKENKKSNISSALNFGKILGKLYFIRNYTKQFSQSLARIVQYGMDYTETLNLWQVAMGKNVDQATEFIDKMQRAYGFATSTLMQYQATFKNMLSALGGISESTSYVLSEFLVQMASDYASLYNTSIQRAMTVFQSVLSGQVRLVRSISGYDITETTIFQLYQQLGGTKTMRQLTQTEKRLLRIYAVFQQMESSGAIGDLNKTLETNSNQIRMLNEQWKELQTWLGNIVGLYLEPILPYLNAITIGLTNITKALAFAMGYQNFEGAIDGVQTVNEELDETTGKLLSFDKFEALNSSGGGDALGLGIDENLINGLSQYNSILDSVSNNAQELAEKWFGWMYEEGEDGTLRLTDAGQKLVDVLSEIGKFALIMIGLGIGKKLIDLVKWITGIKNASQLLSNVMLTGIIYAFIKAIELFKDGEYFAGILAIAIGTTLVVAFVKLRLSMKQTSESSIGLIGSIKQLIQANKLYKQGLEQGSQAMQSASFFMKEQAMKALGLQLGMTALSIAATLAFAVFQSWGDMSTGQRIVAVIGIITVAVLGLAMAFGAFHSAWSLGLATAGIIAGIVAVSAVLANTKKDIESTSINYNARATGGAMYEDGLFTVSRGEIMGQFDDGTTVVANNQQIIQGIKQGVYDAVMSANMQSGGGAGKIDIYLDKTKVGQGVAQSSNREMRRVGLLKANI